ncbi:CehA/McbA family metallohydrolase [Roseateles oligotrophus]|uniref:CehA/McbA family metallohydrolase n=1 Tax=Roseateles oligotrophus TaxID=1769250 RepID=A0ABT2YKT0_9BURK|nr:CehA/McbA family metallohydrolase [Roseateles oligotrophus]MCV2370652.1 CehA/McbA family metallohydrolase [Roseateles oligotrophus]
MQKQTIQRAIALLLSASAASAAMAANAVSPDHQEFEATLQVPYRAAAGAIAEARSFTLRFEYPQVELAQTVSWRLELLDPAGALVQRWYGVESLVKGELAVKVDWAGRQFGMAAMDGVYQVRLTASSAVATELPSTGVMADFVENSLSAPDAELVEQSWDMLVGKIAAPRLPAFKALATGRSATTTTTTTGKLAQRSALAAPAPTGLPYTVYLGNLHSQTGHSDGGGTLGSCGGEQHPQQNMGQGPAQAYQYAMDRGLDILMTSEHNHMFDGDTGTNTAQTPAYAKNLYQSGLAAAANFNAANPKFLGVYGMEWGTISGGGHLNIFNSNELLGWEYNAKGELLADTFTEKNIADKLYTLMAQRGLVGQFNHPASSGQYLVNGTAFGYTADGEKAMALCEVMNTPAFSNTTNESDNGNSGYEGACKKALEAGFKIAFTTNQDNHCANWGASGTNRNGILIPTGVALSKDAFIEAIKARRVFATMDKTSQLILTANGRLMGESFSNAGPLNLVANYAPGAGKAASTVKIFEGVPKRNGTVTEFSSSAVNNFTPALGEHFYYAKVTQTDGKILWSAPIWVTQVADTEAPVVTASVSGSSGQITLNASASDNVGVKRVDFSVDGSLKGSISAAPFSLKLDSSLLANGKHMFSAVAVDAANNAGSSGNVEFSVANVTDVSASVSVSSSGLVFNRATQRYNGNITLTATQTLSGPLQLQLDGLPAGVTLVNATGSHAGSPYITASAVNLMAGASVTVPVSFSNPNKVGLSYSAKIYSGSF